MNYWGVAIYAFGRWQLQRVATFTTMEWVVERPILMGSQASCESIAESIGYARPVPIPFAGVS